MDRAHLRVVCPEPVDHRVLQFLLKTVDLLLQLVVRARKRPFDALLIHFHEILIGSHDRVLHGLALALQLCKLFAEIRAGLLHGLHRLVGANEGGRRCGHCLDLFFHLSEPLRDDGELADLNEGLCRADLCEGYLFFCHSFLLFDLFSFPLP